MTLNDGPGSNLCHSFGKAKYGRNEVFEVHAVCIQPRFLGESCFNLSLNLCNAVLFFLLNGNQKIAPTLIALCGTNRSLIFNLHHTRVEFVHLTFN